MPSTSMVCRPPLSDVLAVLDRDAEAHHARSVRLAVVSAILLVAAIVTASNNAALRRTNSWLDGTTDSAALAAAGDAERTRLDVLAAPVTKLSPADRLRAERASGGTGGQEATAQSSATTDGGKKIVAWFALMLLHGHGFR